MADRAEQIAVWAPRGRDGALAIQLITHHGLSAATVAGVDDLVEAIPEVGCAVITAEVLTGPIRDRLAEALAAQPPWSDLPILLFAPRGLHRTDETLAAVSALGNVSILERPVTGGEFISALRAALRGRRRQYEARDAIRRRDQFLAMLGHELRNPLGAIMLAIEAVPADAGAGGGAGSRQRAIIERQARHLSRLVDDLLDVARVTSGKVRLQPELLELSAIAERCVHGAELAASSRGIELRAELWPHPLYVDADLVRLEEIFNNLISNALKYSPEGARVTVRTRRDGAHCVVEVADTGIGIAPEMLDQVFDLFAQADGSLDRSQGGLGIGLTLVRSLVQLHGGTITATSAGLGHGSRFVVELPSSRSAPRTVNPPRLVAVEPPRARRVLLVEDNIDLLDLTQDLFVTLGYEVATATDGAAGLASLRDAPPDIAFIDIGIPLLDGYDVARRARAAGVASYLVAMTGYGQPEDQRRALAAGFDEHVTKPVGVATLRAALAAAEADPRRPTIAAHADARRRPP